MATDITIPEDLVSVEQAKAHLRLDGITLSAAAQGNLELKIQLATGMVLQRIARPDDDWIATIEAWTDETIPAGVKAAILVQTAELYRFGGDDDNGVAPKSDMPGRLSQRVEAFLMPYIDPAVS